MQEIRGADGLGGSVNEGVGNIGFDQSIANEMLEKARFQLDNFKDYIATEEKQVFIFGGQPAAGKSSIINDVSDKLNGNVVILNGDDYKMYYPNYSELARSDPDATSKLVQPYSNYVVDNLKQEAIAKGINVAVEGTMRNPDAAMTTAKQFGENDYKVEAYVVASNYHNSRVGIELRYETERAKNGYGRMVDPKSHDEAYNNLPNTLKELVDSGKFENITIVNRSGDSIAQLKTGDDIVKSYSQYREQLTPEIYKDVNNKINEVQKLLDNRNAPTSAYENLSKIKDELNKDFAKTNNLTLDKSTKTTDVLNHFAKTNPDIVNKISQDKHIDVNGHKLKLDGMRPEFLAKQLNEMSGNNTNINFENTKTKDYGNER